jgi:hypothetical protein
MQEHLRVLNPGQRGPRAPRRQQRVPQDRARDEPPVARRQRHRSRIADRAREGRARAPTSPAGASSSREPLDPEEAELTAARTVGGGHFGFAERQHVHTNLDQFTDGVVKDVARPLSAFWKAPGPKHAAAVWNVWTHHVFQTVNKTVEQQFQTAMLGKAVRGSLMTDRLMKLSRKATDDAAKGIP